MSSNGCSDCDNCQDGACASSVENVVRKGEVVEHEFPRQASDGVFAFRCSKIANVPYLIVRGTDVQAINADSAKKLADTAKKTVGQYAQCGLEAVTAAFPIDSETGELADLAQGVKQGASQMYERRFRINAGISVF